ncbi:MAG: hypothetical protein JSV88_28885 [Candidatus Aminicenantes bacterium]|nr:MAG: hypothetical protein JSV88_28885 [Candidatus Aminicenantes bacterium]
MKTIKSMKAFDQEIKKRVQAVDREIPRELENAFLEKLNRLVPEKPLAHRHRFIYYGALATAAAILLVIFLFLFPLFHRQINSVEAEEVWVQAARVEGQPASTFIVNQKNPDITIVWIEKINNKMEETDEENH